MSATGHEAGRGYAGRVGLFFAALFLVYGVHLPFLPVWMEWRGLSPWQIGLVTSTPFFLRLLVTPMAAFAADRIGNHRLLVVALAWSALVAALALERSVSFLPIFLCAVVFSLSANTIMPLTETVAMQGVKAGLDYGRMRLWGSLTFIGATFVGGALVERIGASVGVYLLITAAALVLVAAYLLPRPGSAGPAHSSSARNLKVADVLRLASSPLFLAFLLGSGAIQGAHGMFYTFGAVHWRASGISTTIIGILWAIGVLAEVLLFAWSGEVVRRLGAVPLMICGGVAAVVRWMVMGLDPPLAVLVPLQLLHAFSYGATHIGAIHFMARAVPEEQAGTAQALNSAVAAGVAMGGAILVSGPLYAALGARGYLAMAALAAAGLIGLVLVMARWDGTTRLR